MQAADRATQDLLTTAFPTAREVEAQRAQGYERFAELVRRAQDEGALRRDFVTEDFVLLLIANAGVVRATREAAPGAWRRFVGLLLDACRAEGRDAGPAAAAAPVARADLPRDAPAPAPPAAARRGAARARRARTLTIRQKPGAEYRVRPLTCGDRRSGRGPPMLGPPAGPARRRPADKLTRQLDGQNHLIPTAGTGHTGRARRGTGGFVARGHPGSPGTAQVRAASASISSRSENGEDDRRAVARPLLATPAPFPRPLPLAFGGAGGEQVGHDGCPWPFSGEGPSAPVSEAATIPLWRTSASCIRGGTRRRGRRSGRCGSGWCYCRRSGAGHRGSDWRVTRWPRAPFWAGRSRRQGPPGSSR